MVLKEKTQEAFDYIKNHGGRCKTSEIQAGLGLLLPVASIAS